MKKLFFILILVTFQTSYAQWEKTGWKSGRELFSIWAQDSIIILDDAYNSDSSGITHGLTISLDSGKTFPSISTIPSDVYFQEVVIVGESLFLVGADVLWRSDDWGASWTSKMNGLPKKIPNTKLLAVGDRLFLGTFLGLFASSDRGETWQNLKNGIDSNSTVANISQFRDKLILLKDPNPYSKSKGVFFSSDMGNSWQNRTDTLNNYANYNKIIFIGDTIILGSTPGEKGQWFCFTTDEGATWDYFSNDVLSWSSWYDIKSIGSKLLLINDEEFYTSTVDWRTWSQKNEEMPRPLSVGLNDLVVDKNRVYASSGSELWVSYDSAETWKPIITGTNFGYANSLVTCGDTILAATSSPLLPSTYPDGVFSSNDQGESWTPKGIKNGDIRSLISEGNIIIADGLDQSFISTDRGVNWNSLPPTISLRTLAQEFAIIGETIFAIDSAKRIMKSDDFGETWNPKNAGMPEKNFGTTSLYSFDNKLFAFSDRKLYVSENFGESWEIFGTNLNVEGYSINTHIAAEGSMIALSFDSQCYLSSDNGQSWKNITEGLELAERHFVSALAIKDGVVYLSMYDIGMFVSLDSGKTLIMKNEGLPSGYLDFTNSFAFLGDYIYMGISTGRSGPDGDAIYRAKISDFVSALDITQDPRGLTIAPNPASDFISLKGVAPGERIEIYTQLGMKVLEVVAGAERIDVSELKAGVYFIRIGGKTGKFLKI